MDNLISIKDVSAREINALIEKAENFYNEDYRNNDYIKDIAILFFQPSTRTRIGFEVATHRLGANSVNINELKYQDNMSHSESLEDTIRVIGDYSDILCLRHSDRKKFSQIQKVTETPIINCGDGFNEHPSQTLIDLFTIKHLFGRLDNLKIAIVGDLRHMRTSHSLLLGLSKFKDISIKLISPKKLAMPDEYKKYYIKSGNNLEESESFVFDNLDIIYMCGFAPETPLGKFNDEKRQKYQLDKKILGKFKKSPVMLCPLPRVDEITTEVDHQSSAKYFLQSKLGLYMRMAIINRLLQK